jgi:hypothetical protein
MTHARFFVAFVGLLLMLVPPANAEILGANDPNSYTERRLLEDKLKYNFRTGLEAYKRVGKRDPKWDDAAMRFLEKQLTAMTYAGALAMHIPPDMAELPERIALGRAAIDAGCDDPLVLDLLAAALTDAGQKEESTDYALRAVEPMLQSSYPITRVRHCVARALKKFDPAIDPQEVAKYEQLLFEEDVAVAIKAELPGVERRFIFDIIDEDLISWPIEKQAKFVQAITEAKIDPWLLNMFTAQYQIRAAWAVRGNGVAATVKPEGWQAMQSLLPKARLHLLEAHKLHPEYPEAASLMITVVMGGGGAQDDTLKRWFDQATSAQFDEREAYDRLLGAIRPRWGGSLQTMLAFGLDCAATKRYDTSVPLFLGNILRDIQSEQNGPWNAYQMPNIMEQLATVLTNTADNARSLRGKVYYCSELAGAAWGARRYDIARSAFDKAGEQYLPWAMELHYALAPRAFSGTYALTGLHGPSLLQAETNASAGDFDPAIAAYSNAAKELKADDNSVPFITGRLQELNWLKQFHAGEWVNLIPANGIAGWYSSAGQIEAVDGMLHMSTGDDGARIVCGADFGLQYEFKATASIEAAAGKARPMTANGGVMLAWLGRTKLISTEAQPGTGQIVWRYADSITNFSRFRLQPKTTFTIQMFKGSGAVLVDDRPYAPYRDMQAQAHNLNGRIGLSSSTKSAGVTVKYSEVMIRKLTQPPQATPTR